MSTKRTREKGQRGMSTCLLFTIAFFAVGLGWVVVGLLLPTWLCPGTTSRTEIGLFGDQFGAANALFSGMAFGGVVVAIFLQRRELRETIQEMQAATIQQDQVLRTQVLLHLIDDIRSKEWGDAHAALTAWRRKHGKTFVEDFLEDRGDHPQNSEIDASRRVFVEPLYKLQALAEFGIVDDEMGRKVIYPTAAETMFFIVVPMDRAIAKTIEKEHHWPIEREPVFGYVKKLYPNLTNSFVDAN